MNILHNHNMDTVGHALSQAQERLWFFHKLNPGISAYHLFWAYEITGSLDIGIFKKTLSYLLKRHVIFNVKIKQSDGKLLQYENYPKLNYYFMNLSEYLSYSKQRKFEDMLYDIILKPFKFEKNNYYRIKLIQIEKEKFLFCLVVHQIISDERSIEIFISEMFKLYESFVKGKMFTLPPVKSSYFNFCDQERNSIKKNKYKTKLVYWSSVLKNCSGIVQLPLDKVRRQNQSYFGDTVSDYLSLDLTSKINKYCQKNNLSLFVFFRIITNIMLYRLTGQSRILIGSVITNRRQNYYKSVIGHFANTMLLRTDIESNTKVGGLLTQIKKNHIEALEFGDAPFNLVIEKLKIERDLSNSSIFNVLYQLYDARNEIIEVKASGLAAKKIFLTNKTAQVDLKIFPIIFNNKISINITYNINLFHKSTIRKFLEIFFKIITEIINGQKMSGQLIANIDILTKSDKKIISRISKTKPILPLKLTILDLFKKAVISNSNKKAIEHGLKKISYSELDKKSTQLSLSLRQRGLKGGMICGLLSDRTIDFFICLLAILKNGAIYLPIDSSYTAKRINFILKTSKCRFLLSDRLYDMSDFKGNYVNLQDIVIAPTQVNFRKAKICFQDTAYIIYTSGSTGKPKGVAISHGSILNFALSVKKTIKFDSENRILFSSSISFDMSMIETLFPLSAGFTIVIGDFKENNHDDLIKIIKKFKVNILSMTPSHLKVLLALGMKDDFFSIKKLLIGGEPFPQELLSIVFKKINACLYNLYGPAETTVYACCKELKENGIITVGKPLPGTKIYILDKNRKILPVGIAGELYIGGVGVGQGYINSPNKANYNFLHSPFKKNEKIYRTGDLARLLPGGEIELLGRVDRQVKIMGYRVEPREIESALEGYDNISKSLVVYRTVMENMDKQLVAYFLTKNNKKIENKLLISYLREILSAYMIPKYYVHLFDFPLNMNNKIDILALPSPNETHLFKQDFVLPKSETESILIHIWREVLNIQKISSHDNFFYLGGHSLKAIRVLAKINQEFHIDLPLKTIFQYQHLNELAYFISRYKNTKQIKIPLVKKIKYYRPSYAQKRFLFLYRIEPFSAFYNVVNIKELRGELDLNAFRKAWQYLVCRHESLRTNFYYRDGVPVQIIRAKIRDILDIFDLSHTAKKTKQKEERIIIEKQINLPFKLATSPLVRVALIKKEEKIYTLIVVLHHIITDAWSMDILFRELAILYNAYRKGEKPILESLPIQYIDYAEWEQSEKNYTRIKKHERYWLKTLSGELPILDLPADYPRPPVQTYRGSSESLFLDKATTRNVRFLAKRSNVSLFTLLFAMLNILFYRLTGQSDIIVGTFAANRNYAELSNLIGMFINNLPIRTKIYPHHTFANLLKIINRNIINANNHSEYPFNLMTEKLKLNVELSHSSLFTLIFQFFNQTKEEEVVKFNDIKIENLFSKTDNTPFELRCVAFERAECIIFMFNYSTDIFKQGTIRNFLKIFRVLIGSIIKDPGQRISSLDLLTPKEKDFLLNKVNATQVKYPKNKTISELFEAQVEKTPKRIAVQYKDQRLSYRELNERANQIARYLRKQGVGLETVVGLMTKHSLEAVIGIMGIIKAGGAYLPLDSDFPASRLNYYLKNSQVKKVLLTTPMLAPTHRVLKGVGIVNFKEKAIFTEGKDNFTPVAKPHNLACIIYTSGSTGQPKGVMLHQQGIINYAYNQLRMFRIRKIDSVCLSLSLNHVPSLWQIFSPLFIGAKIILYQEIITKNPLMLFKKIEEDNVNLFETVPSALKYFFKSSVKPRSPKKSKLKAVLIGSEMIEPDLISDFYRYFYTSLFIGYGCSECTGDTLYYHVPRQSEYKHILSGSPTINTQAYILDSNMEILPPGLTGELYVSGDGLARGYINDPQRTKEVFLSHPFLRGEKIYKTGDLAKMHSDGNIEILGRIDHQIKIRGMRVEPGEIEANLRKFPGLQDAVVLSRTEKKNKDSYLVAYYTTRTGKPLPAEILKNHLKNFLPSFMIPLYFIHMAVFPLNRNNKLDRAALPLPSDADLRKAEYEPPETEAEKKIAAIWQEILGVEKIACRDNFFDLGGHSLKAIRVLAEIKNQFNINLSLKQIFQNPYLNDIAAVIDDLVLKKYLRSKL